MVGAIHQTFGGDLFWVTTLTGGVRFATPTGAARFATPTGMVRSTTLFFVIAGFV